MASFPLNIVTELQIDGVWTDVSTDVLQRDPIKIKRGRQNESAKTGPSTCELTLNNSSGNYSPRNPAGAYYGLLGRNTPLRVSVNGAVRFTGEVPAWPQSWDRTGNDRWVSITASGILRRLLQGGAVRSAMRRAIPLESDLVAYWPCEDGGDVDQLSSALPGHPPMMLDQPINAAAFKDFTASAPIPTVSGRRWSGLVPEYPATGAIALRFLLHAPLDDAVDMTLFRIVTTGFGARWDLDLDTGGDLRLRAFDSDGLEIGDSGVVGTAVNDRLLLIEVAIEDTGSGVDWSITTLEVRATATPRSTFLPSTFTGTFALVGDPVGRATEVIVDAGEDLIPVPDNVALGHISLQSAITGMTAMVDPLNAWFAETALARIERLCVEDDVAIEIVGTLDHTTALGAQLPATTVALLRDAETADLGILYEPREFLGLAYRTRGSLYSQPA